MKLPINEIICGDCLEVMKDWPSGCIDLLITSPPYGKLRTYKNSNFQFEPLAQSLYHILSEGGVIVWIEKDECVGGSETGDSFRHALYFISRGFRLYDTMIYAKNGCTFPTSGRYYDAFEYMFVLSKGKPKTLNLITDKPNIHSGKVSTGRRRQKDDSLKPCQETFRNPYHDIGRRYNVWFYNTGWGHSAAEPIAFEHPAIFPEALVKDHIISWSNRDDLVLDPMNGAGTTTKMAAKLGRRYIGIDISKEYCQIARDRLEAVDTGVPVNEKRKGQQALF